MGGWINRAEAHAVYQDKDVGLDIDPEKREQKEREKEKLAMAGDINDQFII